MARMVKDLYRLRSLLLAVILGLLWTPLAVAQGEPEVLPLQATDGFPLQMTYYPALASANPNGIENAPVVLLLHGEKGRRLDWDKGSALAGRDPLPKLLQEKGGYAVITLDLRKHGDSIVPGRAGDTVQPNDYLAMVAGDLAAVKNFLFEQHQAKKLNMNKLGIVATDFSVPLALGFAELDWKQVPYDDSPVPATRTPRGQDVRALVLISPQLTAGRVNGAKSLNYLKNPGLAIAFMFIAGDQDAALLKNAKTFYQSATSIPRPVPDGEGPDARSPSVQLVTANTKDAGVPLLVKTSNVTLVPMLKFLDDYVKNSPVASEWRDRRSRLER